MRTELRALAALDPAHARSEAVNRLSTALWSSWRPVLSAAGMTAPAFRNAIAGAALEIWLWVVGERTFDQLLDGLIGRTLRRSRPLDTRSD